MKIEKIINNNIVSAFNEEGQEVVLMGRGIGFGKKAGYSIDIEQVEKVFCMETKKSSDQLKLILGEVPLEHAQITNEIVAYAKERLETKLNENIYVTLTDHISYAIKRQSHGTVYHNALIWEIKKFYTQEYKVGLYAVKLIEERLGINLGEDEAGTIALHIVNAEFNTTMNKAVDITKLIRSCISIVKYHYNIQMNEEDINVERFVTHLKFFAQRIFADRMLLDEDDVFNQTIVTKYSQYFEGSELIRDLIKKEYDIEITREEMIYITVHIGRIVRNFERNSLQNE